MPANTPRGYPYPLPADPADIPQSLEDLALAVDLDAEAVSQTIGRRPAFRLAGTSPVSLPLFVPSPSAIDTGVLSFDRVDMNVGGALAPLDGSATRIMPALPGFWWVQAIMNIPRAGSTNLDEVGLSLQTETATLVRANTHRMPPASDGSNNLVVTTGVFLDGTTDLLSLWVNINKTATTFGSYTIRQRYMLAVRMTES